MASRATTSSANGLSGTVPFFNIGQGRTEAAVALQKELLKIYQQASCAWLDRVGSEVALWSELGTKLTATHSVPEVLDAYTNCVSKQMQMSVDDGQHLFRDCQQIAHKITTSLSNGWSANDDPGK